MHLFLRLTFLKNDIFSYFSILCSYFTIFCSYFTIYEKNPVIIFLLIILTNYDLDGLKYFQKINKDFKYRNILKPQIIKTIKSSKDLQFYSFKTIYKKAKTELSTDFSLRNITSTVTVPHVNFTLFFLNINEIQLSIKKSFYNY